MALFPIKPCFHQLRSISLFWVAPLKKLVRGVRPIERSVSEGQEPIGEVVKGYCLAVRSALTDEGHPPL
nr:hypothetical protein [Xenococcaceae cyanobacterium MO_188.B32]